MVAGDITRIRQSPKLELLGLIPTQVASEHADFNSSAASALPGLFPAGGGPHVAHTQDKDAVHRNRIVEDEVPHHGVGHSARVGDRRLALTRSIAMHFDNVVMLILHA